MYMTKNKFLNNLTIKVGASRKFDLEGHNFTVSSFTSPNNPKPGTPVISLNQFEWGEDKNYKQF